MQFKECCHFYHNLPSPLKLVSDKFEDKLQGVTIFKDTLFLLRNYVSLSTSDCIKIVCTLQRKTKHEITCLDVYFEMFHTVLQRLDR